MLNKKIAIFASILIILFSLAAGFFILNKILKILPHPSEPEVSLGQLYFTDFSDAGELKNWEIIDAEEALSAPSEWKISNRELAQKSSISKKHSLNPGSFLLLKEERDWQDYKITLKFKPEKSSRVGFLVRYQDEDNFYKISLACDKDLKGPFIRIDKIKDGKSNKLYRVKKCYKVAQENEVKITVKGNRIDFYLNSDKVTIYGIDKGEPIPKGIFGFMVSIMPDVSFDNLEITGLSPEGTQSEEGSILGEKTEEQKLDEKIEALLEEIGFE